MKILVDEMPESKHECLFARETHKLDSYHKEEVCFFREVTGDCIADTYCPGVHKCPYLKAYKEPAPVREYPSYFTPCC